MARRRAPVKKRRWAPTSSTREGPSNTMRSTSASVRCAAAVPGVSTVPLKSSRMGPTEGLEPDHHREERSGAAPTCGGGAGAGGHLDEGVGAALGGCPLQVEHRGLATEPGLGLGPVGVEQLRFDAAQGGVDDGTRHRVERDAPEPQATEALGQVQLPGRSVLIGALLGAVGIHDRLPAVTDPLEVGEPAAAGQLQEPFVIGVERVGRTGVADPEQRGHMGSIDVAGRPCLLDGGQGPQRAGVAQALTGDLDRHPLLPRQPGGAGLGARGAPGALGIPARQHPGFRRVEATAQALHRQHRVRQRVVIDAIEVDGVQLREHRGGPVEHVSHISSHGTPLRGPSAADEGSAVAHR